MKFFSEIEIEKFEFSFLNPDQNYWTGSWDYQNNAGLPELIRCNLEVDKIELPDPLIINVYTGKTIPSN